MDINMIKEIAIQFWGLEVVVVGGIVYLFANKNAKAQAKAKAKELILEAEEQAEAYALKTGKDKFDWVVENGYTVLPAQVRLFVSKDAFKLLVQWVFDKAIDWAEEEQKLAEKQAQAQVEVPAQPEVQAEAQPQAENNVQ